MCNAGARLGAPLVALRHMCIANACFFFSSEKLLEADGLKFAEPVKHIKVFEGIPIEVGKAAISEVESRFLLCPLCASAGDMSFCIHLADA
uniref:Uncharacterized protein n=1 Tax=Parascaris equorum TaxID=6256 RepID=A0A914RQN0_PAREQ